MRQSAMQLEQEHAEAIGDAEQLRVQITWFETRLKTLGFTGDCAYERAMAGVYERKIIELERRLQQSHLHGLP